MVVWIRTTSIGLYVWIISLQYLELSGKDGGVTLLEKVCHGCELWGFKSLPPSHCTLCPLLWTSTSQLLLQTSTTIPHAFIWTLTLWKHKPNETLSFISCLGDGVLWLQWKSNYYSYQERWIEIGGAYEYVKSHITKPGPRTYWAHQIVKNVLYSYLDPRK